MGWNNLTKNYYPGSLHCHTDYSNLRLRDSINTYSGLIDKAIELGHEVVAITEHESVSNVIKVGKYYRKIKNDNPNFKVIFGNEIYLVRNGLNKENFQSNLDKYYHFILLAKDSIGHEQIRQISTRAWNRSYVSNGLRRVPTYYSDLNEIIGKNKGHVIASTACLGGVLATQLLRARDTENQNILKELGNWILYMKNMFGEDFYLEMQPSNNEDQIYVNQEIVELAQTYNVKYIITTDAHYLTKADAPIHEAYLNSQDGDREVKSFYETTYMMGTEELESFFNYFTKEQIISAYDSIREIKSKCEDYTLEKPLKIPELMWKQAKGIKTDPKLVIRIPNLKLFIDSSYEGDRLLAKLLMERITEDSTLQNKETYDRVNKELEMTWVSSEKNNTHWSAYFLNLQKIIDSCWEAGSIVGCGRGSGVGFLLLYILDITQINPLRETTTTYSWRFLNPDRVSVLDIDFDISGLKRSKVLNHFREIYGEDRVANVATFGTEKSKSAILTACRGLGIDSDIGQYLASLIPADRGMLRTLSQCMYGDKENNFMPVQSFVKEMNNYPQVWEVAKKIEGLVCRMGVHAGGVIFVDEDFTKSTALMRAPDGTIITQFDLHDAEDVSLIKYDALSVEAMDRIQTCIKLLLESGIVEDKGSLRANYENIIDIYGLERDNPEMWEMVWEHKISNLFQMTKQSGINGINVAKPSSVDELATLNSVIRLMAQPGDDELPLEKYARFKQDIKLWYNEMAVYGLSAKEQELLKGILSTSFGICESQERFMTLVQLPELGGFSLTWADKLRKSIAKKNPAAYLELEKEFFKVTKEKGCSAPLCNYVWRVLIATSRGYGFNLSHTLAYSLIGLQEMNLAFKYPMIFWDCANLIVDSGGDEELEDASTDYGKTATAISKLLSEGNTKVSLVDINKSQYSFSPDVENNQILYGMIGLVRVSPAAIEEIINNRPYTSFADFCEKTHLNKTVMLSLIKSGAFDELEAEAGELLGVHPRVAVMYQFVKNNCKMKSKITLQNMAGLIERNLVPQSLNFAKQVFNFNKYIKKHKVGEYYKLDEVAYNFYTSAFDIDEIEIIDGCECIHNKRWDRIYQTHMDSLREWIKENHDEILQEYNDMLFEEYWRENAEGSLSKWEMESLCFYYHEHELAKVNKEKYGIVNFSDIISEDVERYFPRNGSMFPIYRLNKIIGTVIDRDDNHSTVTLLTTDGVVPVKFTKEYYNNYKKQISEADANGVKHVTDKSWFTRGEHLLVTGFKRENMFVAKSYSRTKSHQLYKITNITKEGDIEVVHERV